MQRDFDQQIFDLDGEPTRIGASAPAFQKAINKIFPKLSSELQKEFITAFDAECGKPLTFGQACVIVLTQQYQSEQELDLIKRMDRAELARRIHKCGVQEITPADRDLIKPLITKGLVGIMTPVIVAEMLETDSKK